MVENLKSENTFSFKLKFNNCFIISGSDRALLRHSDPRHASGDGDPRHGRRVRPEPHVRHPEAGHRLRAPHLSQRTPQRRPEQLRLPGSFPSLQESPPEDSRTPADPQRQRGDGPGDAALPARGACEHQHEVEGGGADA